MRGTLIFGAGPGGTGPLVWAAQNGQLDRWLADGIAVLDRGGSMGGSIGRYVINSDSLSTVYLECLDAPSAREIFAPMRGHATTRALEAIRYNFPPLTLVGSYLDRLGVLLQDAIVRHPNGEFLPHADVRALHLRTNGSVVAEAVTADGKTISREARTAIMALGGRQRMAAYLDAELKPGLRLADVACGKILPSDALLTSAGLLQAAGMLRKAGRSRVVVLGGSHSAFSVAWVLTQIMPAAPFAAGDIVMLYRRPPRIFYWSRDDAIADGYAFSEQDICPRTQRVNRLGGLRGDGREMWRRLTKRPGTEHEDRVEMMGLSDGELSEADLRQLLREAALVVPAFGYRAGTVPVFDAAGRRLRLKADHDGPAVGRDARMLLTDGGEIANVFGIGLGADYKPWGPMGGEPSFDGQANSLWLYQNDIGGVVYEGIRECLEAARHARPVRRNGVNGTVFHAEAAVQRDSELSISVFGARP